MTVANSGATLSGATSPGAGSAITFTSVCMRHGMAVTVAGLTGVGGAQIHIELSMDGVNWFMPHDGGNFYATANGTFYMRTTTDYPALYARGNLFEVDAGVTGINVTATLASE